MALSSSASRRLARIVEMSPTSSYEMDATSSDEMAATSSDEMAATGMAAVPSVVRRSPGSGESHRAVMILDSRMYHDPCTLVVVSLWMYRGSQMGREPSQD